MTTEILAQISSDHFHAGIVLWNDKVVEVAPIIHYMRGWNRERVREYCRAKGWQVIVVWQHQRPDIDPIGRSMHELKAGVHPRTEPAVEGG